MRPNRLTISRLLGVVLVFGIGFAALKHPTETWACVIVGLVIVTVAGAAIGAVLQRRATWGNFAVVGMISMGLLVGPWAPLGPSSDVWLSRIYPWLHPGFVDRIKPGDVITVSDDNGAVPRKIQVQVQAVSFPRASPLQRPTRIVSYQSAKLVHPRDFDLVVRPSPVPSPGRPQPRFSPVLIVRPRTPEPFLRISRTLIALAAWWIAHVFVGMFLLRLSRLTLRCSGPGPPRRGFSKAGLDSAGRSAELDR